MKKILSMIIVFSLMVLLVGCSNSGDDISSQYLSPTANHEETMTEYDTESSVADNLSSNEKCGDNAYWSITGGTLSISGSGDMYDFTVSLAESGQTTWTSTVPWWDQKREITNVIISDGITSIGSESFRGCTSMTSAEIPDSVSAIGEDAFRGCFSLEEMIVPDSVTKIGDLAFEMTGIKSLVLGAGIEECGKNICKDCDNLEEVTFKDGIKMIGSHAFDGDRGIKQIVLPDSVTTLGDGAFNDCAGVEEITLGNGLTEIPDSCFAGCKEKNLVIPEGITRIGLGVYNQDLTSLTLPSTLSYIGKYAFRGKITTLYYNGDEQQWNAIKKEKGNDSLWSTNTNIIFQ